MCALYLKPFSSLCKPFQLLENCLGVPRDSKIDKSQKVNSGPRGVHDLKIPIQEFLEVLRYLGHIYREFGLDWKVGLITMARSDGYYQPNPRVGIFGVSGSLFFDPSSPIRSWNCLDQHI